jgi:hypothetical protein
LNSNINIHVCNDSARFKMKRRANKQKFLFEKNIYDIENYETMNIMIKKSFESIKIKFLNVALFSEFFINLNDLSKLIVTNHHWNIEHSRLHHREKTFCYIELVEEHWILKNNSFDQKLEHMRSTFRRYRTKSSQSKNDTLFSNIQILTRWKIWKKM